MKRTLPLLTIVCLLVFLAACGKNPLPDTPPAVSGPASAEPPETSEPSGPVHLDALRIELPRGSADSQTLLALLRELPEPLREGMAAYDVEVDHIAVTVGASPADSIRAVENGGVDIAFLPAEAFAEQETELVPILGSGPLFWDQGEAPADWNREPSEAPLVPCYRTLICAAPTEYGRNLAGRTSPTWDELTHARWGVLGKESLPGYRAVDLWLADTYEGNRLSDLPDVTEYERFDDLVKAAAAGDVDVFAVSESARCEEWADAWTLPADRTDDKGDSGLGRSAPIGEETPVLALTERFYDMAAVAKADAVDACTANALAEAIGDLSHLAIYDGDFHQMVQAGFGREDYGVVTADALQAARRLHTIE